MCGMLRGWPCLILKYLFPLKLSKPLPFPASIPRTEKHKHMPRENSQMISSHRGFFKNKIEQQRSCRFWPMSFRCNLVTFGQLVGTASHDWYKAFCTWRLLSSLHKSSNISVAWTQWNGGGIWRKIIVSVIAIALPIHRSPSIMVARMDFEMDSRMVSRRILG